MPVGFSMPNLIKDSQAIVMTAITIALRVRWNKKNCNETRMQKLLLVLSSFLQCHLNLFACWDESLLILCDGVTFVIIMLFRSFESREKYFYFCSINIFLSVVVIYFFHFLFKRDVSVNKITSCMKKWWLYGILLYCLLTTITDWKRKCSLFSLKIEKVCYLLFFKYWPCGLPWLGKLDGDTLEPWIRPEILKFDIS